MTRYQRDYLGIPADIRSWRGADPNYREQYRGQRMRGDERQAAYGWHRWTHPEDFGSSGGFYGRTTAPGLYTRKYESDYGGDRQRIGAYDRDWSGGGVRDLRHDREALRDFNANSPTLHPEARRRRAMRYGADYASDHAPQQYRPRDRFMGGHHQGYANRGLSSGGYSEGWAWGPMRGAR